MSDEVQKGRRALLFMQMFSTLGFSILYSTLILYTTQGLHLKDQYATAFTAGFIAFNYSLHVLGGYIGGRLLSYRSLFIIGMLLQALGCLVLSRSSFSSLVIGTAIFLSGCGLNVICINCMLTQLFDPEDKRRESAFLWNYSGMNLGFLIGFTISGFFQLQQNFHTLFLFAAGGSLISFFITLFYWKLLSDQNTLYSESKNRLQRGIIAGVLILALIGFLSFLLNHAEISNLLIALSGVFMTALFLYFAFREKGNRARKLKAFVILGLSSLVFWTLYQMAPMGLTLFFERNVHRELFGMLIPPQWLQNVNTFVIILGGPVMSFVNQLLREKGFQISIPFQFTTALILIGTGYLLLPVGIFLSDAGGFSSIGWIIGCYLFQSSGELFISPIGYAMVGQLIPRKMQGLAMGAWLMITGVAAVLSSYFSQLAIGDAGVKNPLLTNASYSSTFFQLGIYALLVGVILFFLKSFLHRLILEDVSLKSKEPAPYNAPQD